MINLQIKCNNSEEMFSLMETFHNALVGSPGYIGNEIIISEDPEDNSIFNLIVGECNKSDINLSINASDIKEE